VAVVNWTPAEILFLVGFFCAVILALFSIATVVGWTILRLLPWLVPTWMARILAEEGFDRRRVERPAVPVVPGCGDCMLARDAGEPTLARHLALVHGVLQFDRRAA
jgi:hypothetical protein